MEILPVNDLDVALHNFVNKDDKMAFYTCVQYNLQETRVSIIYFLLKMSTGLFLDLLHFYGRWLWVSYLLVEYESQSFESFVCVTLCVDIVLSDAYN